MDEIFEQNRIEREYIKNAQVGDLFYCIPVYDTRTIELKVVRVTKTQIVLENEVKINKETGHIVGRNPNPTWSPTYLPACLHVMVRMEMVRRRLKTKSALKSAEEALQSRIRSLTQDMDVEAMEKMTEALEALLK
jgi:hypothetical protein